jgi:hypothetical protein
MLLDFGALPLEFMWVYLGLRFWGSVKILFRLPHAHPQRKMVTDSNWSALEHENCDQPPLAHPHLSLAS